MQLGLHWGTVQISAILVQQGRIIDSFVLPHRANSRSVLYKWLTMAANDQITRVGITASKPLTHADPPWFIDPIIAYVEGVVPHTPQIRHILFISHDQFGLIDLDANGNYQRHTLNAACGAGTGSFIDQQARRLNMTPSELFNRALLAAGEIPNIATRCAVFAKTDLIHYQQAGWSIESICAGLCQSVVRTILDTLLKGRSLNGQLAVIGSLALNHKLIAEIEAELQQRVLIPPHAHLAHALGAAQLAAPLVAGQSITDFLDQTLYRETGRQSEGRPGLALKLTRYPETDAEQTWVDNGVEMALYTPMLPDQPVPVVLGLDIGSTSTKAALMDLNRQVRVSAYTRTAGNPVQAVQAILNAFHRLESRYRMTWDIRQTGTTGSGRKLIRALLKADFEINEISAQARAAAHLHPEVDTIIEIGGQDAKFIRLSQGQIIHSAMNYACAAGTGAFIEELAHQMGISLADYSRLALGNAAPYTSDRCTVYMERDLQSLRAQGWSQGQILAAIIYSIRDNYVSKVINRTAVGSHLVFQGAVAKNQALVAAFEDLYQQPIHVSQFCHITGAIGVCDYLLERQTQPSAFVGLAFGKAQVETRLEVCELCPNQCRLNVLVTPDQKVASGMQCGRDYCANISKGQTSAYNALIQKRRNFREALAEPPHPSRGKIGIPLALGLTEQLPFWQTFFEQLGYTVVTGRSTPQVLATGRTLARAEFCVPLTLAHGQIHHLADAQVDFIFAPALHRNQVRQKPDSPLITEKMTDTLYCHFSEYLPIITADIPKRAAHPIRLLSPRIDWSESPNRQIQRLADTLAAPLSLTRPALREAFFQARTRYAEYQQKCLTLGAEILSDLTRTGKTGVLLMGRPYIVQDPVTSLDLPRKISDLGYPVLFPDMVDVNEVEVRYTKPWLANMHWLYGQRLLRLTEIALKHQNLMPVFLTSFGCGPDAFVMDYVKDILHEAGKPFAILQLDAHGSDTGYITRLEAAFDTFERWKSRGAPLKPPRRSLIPLTRIIPRKKTVLVPHFDDTVSRFMAGIFKRYGLDSQVLIENQDSLIAGFRHISGGQCMPVAAIIGGIIETVKQRNLNPENVIVYLPGTPTGCNFVQIAAMARHVFDQLGWKGFEIHHTNFYQNPGNLPFSYKTLKWQSYILAALVKKLYYYHRAREIQPGSSQWVFQDSIQQIERALAEQGDLVQIFKSVVALFRQLEISDQKKPKIALLGDLYVRQNRTINQSIEDQLHTLGAEIVMTAMTEYYLTAKFMDLTYLKAHKQWLKYTRHALEFQIAEALEHRFSDLTHDLLGQWAEPRVDAMYAALAPWGITPESGGETCLTLARTLLFLEQKAVDAIVHVNPMFCGPGIVSTALLDRVEQQYKVPIINIFYDGTGTPNDVLIPHLHYLNQQKRRTAEVAAAVRV